MISFGEDEFIEVLVKLTEQADTGKAARDALAKLPPAAPGSERKGAAGRAVVDALKKKAENSQGPLKALLEKEKQRGSVLEFEPYFIVNLLYVKAKEEVIVKLSSRPDVDVIMPNTKIPLELPASEEFEPLSSDGAEWNIERVGAPAVWEQLGIDGAGVVVGMIDTGIHWQHEALKEKWRGFDPQNPDPIYNWYDPVYHTTMPRDLSHPHGTHVMGTVLGSTPGAVIGVAPGARWIAANAFTDDDGKISANSHHILAAAQYMLAPLDANGNPNPDYAPDVINNSWGSAGINDWFRPMVQSWRNAGIFPVFAAGNTGPTAGSIQLPAYYPESFAVGALSWDNRIAQFSSRGPGPYGEVIKPDVVAPGVNIRSSVPGGYQNWQGTSMAAPHVAGIAALLRSADPSISVSDIEEILIETATPLTDSTYPDSPNHGYGYGLVDAYAAVEGVVSKTVVITGQVLLEGADLNPPVIQHTPLAFTYSGVDTALMATITDETSVQEAEVLLQADGQWYSLEMERFAGDHREGEYGAVIPWFLLSEGNVAYRIRARDFSGNTSETPLYTLTVKYGLEPEHSQDFSSFPFGWRWDGDWGWGYPQVGPVPLEGGKLMATNLQGNYSHNLGSILLSPPIDLREAQNPKVYFDHWYDIEYYFDGGIVWVTADYGNNWVILEDFSGQEKQWFTTQLDLSTYAGIDNQVYLAFALYSDYSISYPGWYIDTFTVVDEEITLQGYKVDTQEGKTTPAVREIEFDFHPDAKDFNVKTLNLPAGEPETGLPGLATVTILATGQQALTSPDDGSFYLLYTPGEETEVTLVAQAEGFQTAEKVVQIPEGGLVEVNFLLRKLLSMGDVNGDGAISVADAILVLRHIVGLIDIGEVYGLEALGRAKVSGDDTVSVADAILFLRYIVGLIPGF